VLAAPEWFTGGTYSPPVAAAAAADVDDA